MPLLFGLMSSTVHQRVIIGIKVQLLSVPSYAMRILLFVMPGVPLVFADVRTFHSFIWIGDTEYPIKDSVSPTKLSVVDVKPGFAIEAIKLPFGVFVSIGGAGSPLISSGEQWGYKIARIPELVGASLSGICGFMWTQYANHNDAVWVSVDKNTGALNVDYKSETQDWIYTFHASGMLLFN